jgi:ADP-ribosylglycohydrolase
VNAPQFNPLLGQAIGDRIGGPVRMAMMLGHAIADAIGLDTTLVLQRYLAWHRTDAFDTGPTWSAVLEDIANGTAPATAVQRVHAEQRGLTAGANTAHRATAIGCAAVIPDAQVGDAARTEARLTHWHPDAAESSAATATIVRSMLRGATLDAAVSEATRVTTGVVHTLLSTNTPDRAQLSRGGYAPKVLEAAVYFARTATDFPDAIRRSIHFAGMSNYCPVLVGAFAALRFGVVPVEEYPVDAELSRAASDAFARGWLSRNTGGHHRSRG